MTPYLYSTYDEEDEAPPTAKRKIIILGSGPNRIGQGIEFDYCCCHAAFALKEDGYETIMVNCNPETVSTDYDTSDRLYFEPLTLEDVLAIYEHEASSGAEIGMIVQFGGQTPLNLAQRLRRAGVPIHWHFAGVDRPGGRPQAVWKAARGVGDSAASGRMATSVEEALAGRADRLSGAGAALVCAGRAGDGDCVRCRGSGEVHDEAVEYSQDRPVLVDHFLEMRSRWMWMRCAIGEDVVIAASCSISKRRAFTRATLRACCRRSTFGRRRWRRFAPTRASWRWR
jgi:carbamoyl-phosphate synthase large subunit